MPNYTNTINFEVVGVTNKKIFLSNIEYNLLDKRVKNLDQHVGGEQLIWCDKKSNFYVSGWSLFFSSSSHIFTQHSTEKVPSIWTFCS